MDQVFDMENGIMDLDALRRTAKALVDAEWIVVEYQIKRNRDDLEATLEDTLEDIQSWLNELR